MHAIYTIHVIHSVHGTHTIAAICGIEYHITHAIPTIGSFILPTFLTLSAIYFSDPSHTLDLLTYNYLIVAFHDSEERARMG